VTELALPADLVDSTLSWHGDEGRAWLAALPDLVTDLAGRWRLRVGEAYSGGAVALALRADRDGVPVVLKVSWVDEETRHEAAALSHWDGDGAVRLIDADPERGGLLLERLEPGTPLGDHPDRDHAISIACALLRRLWRPPPRVHPFASACDLAARLAAELPAEHARLGEPFDHALVREAASLCAALSQPAGPDVLVNRDFHLYNVLAGQREPWLLIDPKPLVGEPVFDTGHLLLSLAGEDPHPATVRRLVGRLAAELSLDSDRIRAWAFVRAFDNAVWSRDLGQSPEPDLALARTLARAT
jgi:streptomycin 6-kinase